MISRPSAAFEQLSDDLNRPRSGGFLGFAHPEMKPWNAVAGMDFRGVVWRLFSLFAHTRVTVSGARVLRIFALMVVDFEECETVCLGGVEVGGDTG